MGEAGGGAIAQWMLPNMLPFDCGVARKRLPLGTLLFIIIECKFKGNTSTYLIVNVLSYFYTKSLNHLCNVTNSDKDPSLQEPASFPLQYEMSIMSTGVSLPSLKKFEEITMVRLNNA